MNLGLRLAGTVEIAGYDERSNPRIIELPPARRSEMLELPQTRTRTMARISPDLSRCAAGHRLAASFGQYILLLPSATITWV